MVVASDIPVRISEEAAQYIEETHLQEPFQRMLDYIPRHFHGVRSVNVVFNVCQDQSAGPWAVLEVTREDPGLEKDESDWEWLKWETRNFSPEHLEHLLVDTNYPLVDDAR